MGITVNVQPGATVNNYDIHDNENVYVSIPDPATDTPDIHTDTPGATPPPFEEAIPECFRTGILMTAWDKLRKEGILRDDFQMTDPKAAVAYRLAEYFNEKLKDLNKRANTKQWQCFERFWGFNNLKTRGGDISKDTDNTIANIFSTL